MAVNELVITREKYLKYKEKFGEKLRSMLRGHVFREGEGFKLRMTTNALIDPDEEICRVAIIMDDASILEKGDINELALLDMCIKSPLGKNVIKFLILNSKMATIALNDKIFSNSYNNILDALMEVMTEDPEFEIEPLVLGEVVKYFSEDSSNKIKKFFNLVANQKKLTMKHILPLSEEAVDNIYLLLLIIFYRNRLEIIETDMLEYPWAMGFYKCMHLFMEDKDYLAFIKKLTSSARYYPHLVFFLHYGVDKISESEEMMKCLEGFAMERLNTNHNFENIYPGYHFMSNFFDGKKLIFSVSLLGIVTKLSDSENEVILRLVSRMDDWDADRRKDVGIYADAGWEEEYF
jgi:hypothetical protein